MKRKKFNGSCRTSFDAVEFQHLVCKLNHRLGDYGDYTIQELAIFPHTGSFCIVSGCGTFTQALFDLLSEFNVCYFVYHASTLNNIVIYCYV